MVSSGSQSVRYFMRTTIRITLAQFALMVTAFSQQAQTFEHTPIRDVPEMEIVAPNSPTVLHAGGKRSLCYELFITNMKNAAFTLKRVKLIAEGGDVLLDSRDSDLTRTLIRVGKPGEPFTQDALINRGERVIYYAWADLAKGAPVPKILRHELTFENGGGTFTIRAAEVAVSDQIRILSPPLRGENWFAANGPSNGSMHRRALITLDGLTRAPERFAIDWVQIGANELTFSGDRNENANYYCYGKEVLAVADGVVSAVKDGIPENKPASKSRAVPITLDTVGGNHVILDIGGGLFAFYAHLQPGKTRVKVGDRVKAGEVIGLVGNSGNSSEPHLHFHVCDRSSPLACQGVPFAFESFILQGRARELTPPGELELLVQSLERKGEMPAENELVSFPR